MFFFALIQLISLLVPYILFFCFVPFPLTGKTFGFYPAQQKYDNGCTNGQNYRNIVFYFTNLFTLNPKKYPMNDWTFITKLKMKTLNNIALL